MNNLAEVLFIIFAIIIIGISTGEKPTIFDGIRARINNIECGGLK